MLLLKLAYKMADIHRAALERNLFYGEKRRFQQIRSHGHAKTLEILEWRESRVSLEELAESC